MEQALITIVGGVNEGGVAEVGVVDGEVDGEVAEDGESLCKVTWLSREQLKM